MNKSFAFVVGGLLFGAALISAATASGSYPPPIIRPPSDAAPTGSVDAERYNLGKELVAGKVRLPEAPLSPELAAAQSKELEGYSNKLPKPVRESLSLQPLAGRLTEAQLAAVNYFLTIRYKVKLD